MDRRTRARELAMQALFQLDAQGEYALGVLEKFFKENSEDEMIRSQARKWTLDAWENIESCDELIQKASGRWQLSRISAVERSILRICAYQLAYCPEIPPKVVINEGIEMSKKFSTGQSSGFVNGVLDAVRKNLDENKQEKE